MLLTHRYPTTVTKTNLAQSIIQAFPSLRSDGPLGYVSFIVLCILMYIHFINSWYGMDMGPYTTGPWYRCAVLMVNLLLLHGVNFICVAGFITNGTGNGDTKGLPSCLNCSGPPWRGEWSVLGGERQCLACSTGHCGSCWENDEAAFYCKHAVCNGMQTHSAFSTTCLHEVVGWLAIISWCCWPISLHSFKKIHPHFNLISSTTS